MMLLFILLMVPAVPAEKISGQIPIAQSAKRKEYNYALKAANKEEFIKAVTDGIPPPPQYFPINAKINKEGYDSIDDVLINGMKAIPVAEFKELAKDESKIILDTRRALNFTHGFVPGSISIGLEGRFAEWAGSLLPFDAPIAFGYRPGKRKRNDYPPCESWF